MKAFPSDLISIHYNYNDFISKLGHFLRYRMLGVQHEKSGRTSIKLTETLSRWSESRGGHEGKSSWKQVTRLNEIPSANHEGKRRCLYSSKVLKTLLGTCLTTVWFIPVPARRGLLEGGWPKLCVLYLGSSKIRVSGLTLAPANSDAMPCSELNLSSQQKNPLQQY